LPSRARQRAGLDEELPVDGVGDAPLESADGFLLSLAFGDLALEERAARRVREADLGDGDDVEGVVQLPVVTSRKPMGDPGA
jgi:hypothetical protein